MSDSPHVVVAIASAGRPQLLADLLENLSHQTYTDFEGIVSVPDEHSLPDRIPAGWRVVTGSRGLAAQRNAALDSEHDADFVFFFDDDAVVREDYLAHAIEFFDRHPDIAGLTGLVLLDGAVTGEISPEAAAEALANSSATPIEGRWRTSRTLYGCNFAYRVSSSPDIRFDSRLPLYSWLEDHDFARRLMNDGELARVEDCVIVHRAASSGGRQAHSRLGYSQMMNPIHLWRKGSFPLWLAVWEIFRPTAKNVAKSIAGEEKSWRRQRLRANGLALRDALRGRITPERILEF